MLTYETRPSSLVLFVCEMIFGLILQNKTKKEEKEERDTYVGMLQLLQFQLVVL